MPGIWPFSHEMKSPRRQGSQVKSQPPNQPTPTRSPAPQRGDAFADCVDDARDLVAGSARERVAQRANHGEGIGVADAAGVHLDADMSRARLGDFDIGYFELSFAAGTRAIFIVATSATLPGWAGAQPVTEAERQLSCS